MSDAKVFRTLSNEDPFEKLQKWTTWLFGLNPLLAALAFGAGRFVVSPQGGAVWLPALSALCFGISLAFTACAYGTAVAETQPADWIGRFSPRQIGELRAEYNRKRTRLAWAAGFLAGALVLAALTPLGSHVCSRGQGWCLRSPEVALSYTLKDTVLVAQDTIFTDAQVLHAQAVGRELTSERRVSLVLEDSGGTRPYATQRAAPDSLGRVRLAVSARFEEREEVRLRANWCPELVEADGCTETIPLTPTPRNR